MKKSKKIFLRIISIFIIIFDIIVIVKTSEFNITIFVLLLFTMVFSLTFVKFKSKEEINKAKTIEEKQKMNNLLELEKQYKKEQLLYQINKLKEINKKCTYECTYCNCVYNNKTMYCPSCGAKTKIIEKDNMYE